MARRFFDSNIFKAFNQGLSDLFRWFLTKLLLLCVIIQGPEHHCNGFSMGRKGLAHRSTASTAELGVDSDVCRERWGGVCMKQEVCVLEVVGAVVEVTSDPELGEERSTAEAGNGAAAGAAVMEAVATVTADSAQGTLDAPVGPEPGPA